ncbi:hypothetical protein OUZ56_028254 [Daphnia magna]|uniref:Uncharacterized protein n=1 Tax=Daphnia magna TaxID=35525 RepID=A0ABR0B3B0_9CRUS|nr:hypothetical protein OUZ56_028254 [Daphnia magna]
MENKTEESPRRLFRLSVRRSSKEFLTNVSILLLPVYTYARTRETEGMYRKRVGENGCLGFVASGNTTRRAEIWDSLIFSPTATTYSFCIEMPVKDHEFIA